MQSAGAVQVLYPVFTERPATPKHRCPTCGQWIVMYRRKLNNGMARSLIWLVKTAGPSMDWVDVPHSAPRHVLASRELNKLLHWSLVETMPNTDDSKTHSGHWQPTTVGVQFAYGYLKIPAYVYLLHNEVQGFSREMCTVQEAISKHFNFTELWSE